MVRQTLEEMYARRIAGESLKSIGKNNDVSRERIRQLIKRYEQQTGAEPSNVIASAKRQAVREQQQALLEKYKQDEEEKVHFSEMSREQQDQYIRYLSAQGIATKFIAARCGVSYSFIWTMLKAPGKVRKLRKVPSILVQKWLSLYREGATQVQIAKQTGYSQAVVSKYLHRLVATRRRLA